VSSHKSLQGPSDDSRQGDLWPWALTMAASLVMYYEDIRNDSTRKDENRVIQLLNGEAAQCGRTVATLRSCGQMIREHYKTSNERNAINSGITDAEQFQVQMQYLSSHMGDLKKAAQFGFSQATQQLAVVSHTNELLKEEITALRAELAQARVESTHYLQRILVSVDTLSHAFGVLSVSGSPMSSTSVNASFSPGSPVSQETHPILHNSPGLETRTPSEAAEENSSPASPRSFQKHNCSGCLQWTVADLLYNAATENVSFAHNAYPPGLSAKSTSHCQVKNKAKFVVALVKSVASSEEWEALATMKWRLLNLQRTSDITSVHSTRREIKILALGLHRKLYDRLFGHCVAHVWDEKRVLNERGNDAMLVTASKMYNVYQKQLKSRSPLELIPRSR
jgi:hypothetical protein